MTDDHSSSPPDKDANAKLRSPIRPAYTPPPPPEPLPAAPETPTQPTPEPAANPQTALGMLRLKMEKLVDEYAAGKINRAQFYALYARYNEQRTIIEKLVARNPDSDAWKHVLSVKGQTGFLRSHFEAQVLSFGVFLRGSVTPLYAGGRRSLDEALMQSLIGGLWRAQSTPAVGLGRKELAHGEWLVLAVAEQSASVVIFSLEPSSGQSQLVRDLHTDFERANRVPLARGLTQQDRLVYPQRALVENQT